MNLVAAAPLWLLLVLAAAMVAAAIEDAVRLRISNITSLLVFVGAVAAAFVAGPSWSLWQNAAVFVAILTLGTIAFSAGWLGGGDVKLFAAAGTWFDLRSALWFLALVFLSGGLVAVGYSISRRFRLRPHAGLAHSRVPYGIAIAVGALIMILADGRAFRQHQQPQSPLRHVTVG